jgi:S1-C subfamily serine protease
MKSVKTAFFGLAGALVLTVALAPNLKTGGANATTMAPPARVWKQQAALSPEAIYQKTASSSVMFVMRNNAGYQPIACGVVVDVKNRLVATAEHVVSAYAGQPIEVMVAEKDAEGRVITKRAQYGRNATARIIRGKVLKQNFWNDLALVQLERLPAGITAVPLASDNPRPGQRVHVIGNSDGSDGVVFSYCQGYVRNGPSTNRGRFIHHTPTNKGDSGGPIVNDGGELVGIVSGGSTGMTSRLVRFLAYQIVQRHANGEKIHVSQNGSDLQQVRDYGVPVSLVRSMMASAAPQGAARTPVP